LSVLAPDIKKVAGPPTVKLLDALAAYRDSELTTADTAPLGLTIGGPRPVEEADLPDPGVRGPDRGPRPPAVGPT